MASEGRLTFCGLSAREVVAQLIRRFKDQWGGPQKDLRAAIVVLCHGTAYTDLARHIYKRIGNDRNGRARESQFVRRRVTRLLGSVLAYTIGEISGMKYASREGKLHKSNDDVVDMWGRFRPGIAGTPALRSFLLHIARKLDEAETEVAFEDSAMLVMNELLSCLVPSRVEANPESRRGFKVSRRSVISMKDSDGAISDSGLPPDASTVAELIIKNFGPAWTLQLNRELSSRLDETDN